MIKLVAGSTHAWPTTQGDAAGLYGNGAVTLCGFV